MSVLKRILDFFRIANIKKLHICRYQARREPQRGPGKHSRGTPKHLQGAPLGKFCLNFFSIWYIMAYFIFLAKGGAPKRRGTRGSLPPYPILSTGLVDILQRRKLSYFAR